MQKLYSLSSLVTRAQLVLLFLISSTSLSFGQNAGTLWGTTFQGGQYNFGTLFKTNADGSGLVAVYSFGNNSGIDGIKPFAELIQASNGKIYGTTTEGGAAGHGVLFEYEPGTNTYTKKIDFFSSDVSDVRGAMIEVNGKLYGMSRTGGSFAKGSLFEYDFNSNILTRKVSFEDVNGAIGKLAHYNGKLYGMSNAGGTNNVGVLFEYDLATGSLTKKLDFGGLVGVAPYGSLYEHSPGIFYGMTAEGGISNVGVIFEYNAITGVYSKKIDLVASDGANPFGTFVKGENDIVYGLTNKGGSNNEGVIFEYNIQQNTYTKKVNLTTANGAQPFGTLTRSSTGKLYASASAGGSSSKGVIFEYNPSTNAYLKKSDFTGANGDYPVYGTLISYREFQTITFAALINKKYGDPDFSLTATSSSGLPVDYISSNTNIATVVGNSVSVIAAGSTTITASQSGNLAYYPANSVQRTQVIDKATPIISFTVSNKIFGDIPFQLIATSTTPTPIVFTSSNNNVASINGTTVTILAAGTTMITASQVETENYFSASVERPLLVNKANQTVTFGGFSIKTYGDAPFALVASSDKQLPVTFISSNTNVASINGSTLTIAGAGTSTIKAIQVGNTNYNSSETEQILTVNKANQTITFNSISTKTYGIAPFNPGASSSSQLAITYTSSNTNVVTASGSVLTIVGAGNVTVTASQSGSNNFNAAPPIVQSFTVIKADQSITFPAIQDKAIGSQPALLNATSSSNLTITYTHASDKISLTGNQVNLLKIGKVTITASQPGNGNYNEAAPVEQSFCVTPLKPVVSVGTSGESVLLTSSAQTGNQWFRNDTAILSATDPVFSAIDPGIYKVQVTIEGCQSEFSDEVPLIVASAEKTSEEWSIYPNPVDDSFNLKLPGKGIKNIHIVQSDSKVIHSEQTQQSEVQIDVHSYASGSYLVMIENNSDKRIVRFIKK